VTVHQSATVALTAWLVVAAGVLLSCGRDRSQGNGASAGAQAGDAGQVESDAGSSGDGGGHGALDASQSADGGALLPDGSTAGDDSLGTVTENGTVTCPEGGVSVAQCLSLTVDCPDIESITVTLKMSAPQSPLGTVLFTSGGGGTTFYDTMFQEGPGVISDVVSGGFKAVQVAWGTSAGWLTGPGGPRKLACRFATVAEWVYENHHDGNVEKPFCASGISAGSAQISYALAHYGLANIFDMVQPCAGPPMGRVDVACLCHEEGPTNPCGRLETACYATGGAQAVDNNWYGGDYGYACRDRDEGSAARFLHDSVVNSDSTFSYPSTDVRFLFGTEDTDPAVRQGLYYYEAITSQKSHACVEGAEHKLADSAAGRNKVVSDLLQYCKLQE
jgi:hypothetical protein